MITAILGLLTSKRLS